MGGRVYFEPRRKILFVVSIRPLTQSQIQWYLPSLVDVGEKGKMSLITKNNACLFQSE